MLHLIEPVHLDFLVDVPAQEAKVKDVVVMVVGLPQLSLFFVF